MAYHVLSIYHFFCTLPPDIVVKRTLRGMEEQKRVKIPRLEEQVGYGKQKVSPIPSLFEKDENLISHENKIRW